MGYDLKKRVDERLEEAKAAFGNDADKFMFESKTLPGDDEPSIIVRSPVYIPDSKWRKYNGMAMDWGGKYSTLLRGWVFTLNAPTSRAPSPPKPSVDEMLEPAEKKRKFDIKADAPVDTGIPKIDDKFRKMAEEERIDDIKWLYTATIKPNAFNPNEMTSESFEALVESMRREGPKGVTPIEVRRIAEDVYEIVDGEHRWRGADRLKWKKIRCMVRDVDDDRAAEINYVKNRLRGKINPWKEADLFNYMWNRTGKQEDVAQRFGVSQSYVAQTLALRKVPTEIQKIIPRGINRSVLEILSRVDDPADQERVAKKMSGETTVREAEDLVRNIQNIEWEESGEEGSEGDIDILGDEERASVQPSPVSPESTSPTHRASKPLDTHERGCACPVCGRVIAQELYDRLKARFSAFTGLFR